MIDRIDTDNNFLNKIIVINDKTIYHFSDKINRRNVKYYVMLKIHLRR